ncbi:glycosyltransferase [Pseudomonas kunmingensis]|uniref:glycosyltransferase family 4 protein n=1 Tax=Stutzerimonas kunmingensis TaxID=1211807 RepID=UPI0015E40066|nr:glycosyltransferase [Stutzerimonas kunmingensis]MBA1239549.1 glycosyltransferase [Stutzerimonas kunmingensis]
MKILYGYRYGIVGGVSTQLLLRQAALRQVGGQCDLFFCQDNGLRQVLPATAVGQVFFGSVRAFQRQVAQGQYDAVVVIDTPELLSVSSKHLFLDVHTTTQAGLSYLDRANLSGLAGLMVPSAYSAGLLAKKTARSVTDIHILPNTLNTAVFNLAVSASAPTCPEFIWVGKLDQHKNWRLALVYARMLKDALGNIRFHMVGGYTAPATVGDDFFNLLHDLEIQDSVVWLDRLANNQLATLFRRCANSGGAMLVTSRDESFGMAAAEALLCGCPLIANDLPVFREVFPEGPMVKRVDIWQPDQVVQAIQQLSSDSITNADRQTMFEALRSQYGAEAFVNALNRMIVVEQD